MKFVFIVQGEGRGHITQALALQRILQKNGHEILKSFIGKSPLREIPEYFFEKSVSSVDTFNSPNFKYDKNKSINVTYTFLYNILKAPRFFKAIGYLNNELKRLQPDVVINFYDLLCGLYFGIYRPSFKMICVGHQYFFQHPDFEFPEKHKLDKLFLNLNTKVTCLRAHKKLGLSFYQAKDIPSKKLKVVPPLLRQQVLDLVPEKQDYILAYMLNFGYAGELINWHQQHQSTEIHAFWDKKDAPEDYYYNEQLVFHRINDIRFLNFMKGCKGYVSTAGFESICEAMYLDKPVMLVPTYGHFEQKCNAIDAVKAGAGIKAASFNLTPLLQLIKNRNKESNETFRKWVGKAEYLFLKELTEL